MRTRDEVLKEFDSMDQLSWHWDALFIAQKMADRIRELESQQAASEPVAWALYRADGSLEDVYTREEEARYLMGDGWTIRPLYAHPSAAAVAITDAMVEAAAKCLRQRDEGTSWCTWDTLKWQTRELYMDEARKVLTAALTAASEGNG